MEFNKRFFFGVGIFLFLFLGVMLIFNNVFGDKISFSPGDSCEQDLMSVQEALLSQSSEKNFEVIDVDGNWAVANYKDKNDEDQGIILKKNDAGDWITFKDFGDVEETPSLYFASFSDVYARGDYAFAVGETGGEENPSVGFLLFYNGGEWIKIGDFSGAVPSDTYSYGFNKIAYSPETNELIILGWEESTHEEEGRRGILLSSSWEYLDNPQNIIVAGWTSNIDYSQSSSKNPMYTAYTDFDHIQVNDVVFDDRGNGFAIGKYWGEDESDYHGFVSVSNLYDDSFEWNIDLELSSFHISFEGDAYFDPVDPADPNYNTLIYYDEEYSSLDKAYMDSEGDLWVLGTYFATGRSKSRAIALKRDSNTGEWSLQVEPNIHNLDTYLVPDTPLDNNVYQSSKVSFSGIGDFIDANGQQGLYLSGNYQPQGLSIGSTSGFILKNLGSGWESDLDLFGYGHVLGDGTVLEDEILGCMRADPTLSQLPVEDFSLLAACLHYSIQGDPNYLGECLANAETAGVLPASPDEGSVDDALINCFCAGSQTWNYPDEGLSYVLGTCFNEQNALQFTNSIISDLYVSTEGVPWFTGTYYFVPTDPSAYVPYAGMIFSKGDEGWYLDGAGDIGSSFNSLGFDGENLWAVGNLDNAESMDGLIYKQSTLGGSWSDYDNVRSTLGFGTSVPIRLTDINFGGGDHGFISGTYESSLDLSFGGSRFVSNAFVLSQWGTTPFNHVQDFSSLLYDDATGFSMPSEVRSVHSLGEDNFVIAGSYYPFLADDGFNLEGFSRVFYYSPETDWISQDIGADFPVSTSESFFTDVAFDNQGNPFVVGHYTLDDGEKDITHGFVLERVDGNWKYKEDLRDGLGSFFDMPYDGRGSQLTSIAFDPSDKMFVSGAYGKNMDVSSSLENVGGVISYFDPSNSFRGFTLFEDFYDGIENFEPEEYVAWDRSLISSIGFDALGTLWASGEYFSSSLDLAHSFIASYEGGTWDLINLLNGFSPTILGNERSSFINSFSSSEGSLYFGGSYLPFGGQAYDGFILTKEDGGWKADVFEAQSQEQIPYYSSLLLKIKEDSEETLWAVGGYKSDKEEDEKGIIFRMNPDSPGDWVLSKILDFGGETAFHSIFFDDYSNVGYAVGSFFASGNEWGILLRNFPNSGGWEGYPTIISRNKICSSYTLPLGIASFSPESITSISLSDGVYDSVKEQTILVGSVNVNDGNPHTALLLPSDGSSCEEGDYDLYSFVHDPEFGSVMNSIERDYYGNIWFVGDYYSDEGLESSDAFISRWFAQGSNFPEDVFDSRDSSLFPDSLKVSFKDLAYYGEKVFAVGSYTDVEGQHAMILKSGQYNADPMEFEKIDVPGVPLGAEFFSIDITPNGEGWITGVSPSPDNSVLKVPLTVFIGDHGNSFEVVESFSDYVNSDTTSFLLGGILSGMNSFFIGDSFDVGNIQQIPCETDFDCGECLRSVDFSFDQCALGEMICVRQSIHDPIWCGCLDSAYVAQEGDPYYDSCTGNFVNCVYDDGVNSDGTPVFPNGDPVCGCPTGFGPCSNLDGLCIMEDGVEQGYCDIGVDPSELVATSDIHGVFLSLLCEDQSSCGDGVVDGDEECEVGVDGAVASCNPACESSCNYCSSSCTWQTATGGSCGGSSGGSSGGSGGGCDRCDPEEAWKCGAYTNCVGGKKECYRWELQKDCCSNTLKPQLDLDCTVSVPTEPEKPSPIFQQKKSWILLIIILLILIAVISGVLIYFFHKKSKQASEDLSGNSVAKDLLDSSLDSGNSSFTDNPSFSA